MKHIDWIGALAGAAAGIINGLFGAGGGMVLIPLLQHSKIDPDNLFRHSLIIIIPMSLVSLLLGAPWPLPWSDASPYLLGAIPGGIVAATLGKRIPSVWLHRILGCFIIYGGIRYLCF